MFDSFKAVRDAGKVAVRADRAELLDTDDLDALEDGIVTLLMVTQEPFRLNDGRFEGRLQDCAWS